MSNLLSTQFGHYNLLPDKPYTVKVEAVFGEYFASAPASVDFRTTPIKKATGIRASSRKAKSAMISWGAVEGSKGYEISYRAAGKSAKVRRTINRGLMLRKLKPGTKYVVKVTTFSAGGGRSSVSKSFTFRTPKK